MNAGEAFDKTYPIWQEKLKAEQEKEYKRIQSRISGTVDLGYFGTREPELLPETVKRLRKEGYRVRKVLGGNWLIQWDNPKEEKK